MRGYFDGDGTVYFTRKNEIMFGIISTKEFCETYLLNLPYNGKTRPIKDYRTTKNVYNLKIGGKNQVKVIFNFLYKDATIYLKRKKDKFDEFFIHR